MRPARLIVALAISSAGSVRFGAAQSPAAEDPLPSLAECEELFFSGRCNQSAIQTVASAGSPLLRPLPFYRIFDVLSHGDKAVLAAWGSWKEMGNYNLCTEDVDSHHCTIQAFGGPSLGICLPRECSVRDYLRRYRCEEVLLFASANATAALIPALANATAALQALSAALEYLALKSKSFCAEDAGYALTPGACAMIGLTVLLSVVIVISTLLNSVFRQACEARGCAPPRWACALAAHFDAICNTRRLLATRAEGDLDFLDGMRCLSTGYVELGHQFMGLAFSSKNLFPAIPQYLRSFEATLILGAFSAVDTFFWMSGLLAALAMLSHAERTGRGGVCKGLRQAGFAILHRYARLTPVYAYVLFAFTFLLRYVGSGPLWVQAQALGDQGQCESEWWTNLLYINNLVHVGDSVAGPCMAWSWYLANDFQMTAVSVLLLAFYPAAPRVVVALFCAAIVASVVATAVLSHIFFADITTLDKAYSAHIYGKPWCRYGTYAIGCLLGIFVHERKRAIRDSPASSSLPITEGAQHALPPSLKAWAHPSVWLASGALLLCVFLAPWSNFSSGGLLEPGAQLWTQWQKDAYNALQRQLWAVGLSGLALWFLSGGGGFIKKLLSLKAWQVFAKLAYGAYLWHVVILFALYLSALDYKSFSRVQVTVDYLTVLVSSFALSFVSYLLVEKPAMNIEGALLAALSRSARGKQPSGFVNAANPSPSQPLIEPAAAFASQAA